VALAFSTTLLNAETAVSNGVAYDTVAAAREIKFFIIGNGTITGGAVTLEEAHDATYTGTWSAFEAPWDVLTNQVIARPFGGCFRAVRARISTTITGGGTVTVLVVGNKEP
jgi:hypothetical protein